MPRVPSDPAQVIVNHASFRVQLGATSARAIGLDDTTELPVVAHTVTGSAPGNASAAASAASASAGASPAAPGRRRLAPVVWSGRSTPGDPMAGQLLQAVRRAGAASAGAGEPGAAPGAAGPAGSPGSPGAATQVLPRIDETTVLPTVVGQRAAQEPTGLLSGVRPARGAYDPPYPPGPDRGEPLVGHIGGGGDRYGRDGERHADDGREGERPRNRRGERVRHAWYPGRRMNLGIVLLPLRIFLGFVCVYAGMGKLCDRVYFDGGQRGSMVTWLSSLHPWALAEPLRNAALNHPVGAGLSIAFLQIVVGVLTVLGLWQRVAAVFGAALSIALLVTVSWRTVPVYDAPHFIYLAAWSPLVIAGAPVYSVDGHLAGDAWRRLGPRVGLWDLRRRVLRRGAVLATVVIGLTMVVGSVLGAAVRATTPTPHRGPEPTVVPTNDLPGEPLPSDAGSGGPSPRPSDSAKARKKHHDPAASQSPSATTPGATGTAGSGSTHTPSYGSSGATSSSGSGGSSSGGSAQSPAAPAAPPAGTPAEPEPSARPTQGAIGGLLGSHSPTGLLLGMSPARSSGNPSGSV